MSKEKVIFGPFVGELGWELLFWQGWVRRLCREDFRDYHKIAVSRLGHDPFYDSCDQFVPIPSEMFPSNYSARSYISDNWKDGYPTNNGSYRWDFTEIPLQLAKGHRPHKIFVENRGKGDSTSKIFEEYLKDLTNSFGQNTTLVVPWKLNRISGTEVGFKEPKDSRKINQTDNFKVPAFREQVLERLKSNYEVPEKLVGSGKNLVAVLPRYRAYRRKDKNWSESNYLSLIDGLLSRGKKVVLVGSPNGAYFSNYTPDGCINLINVPENIRLSTHIAILQICEVAVGAMSGAMLLSLASGCPAIIFGEQSQLHRYYFENFQMTRLNYVADMSPKPEQLLRIFDSF